MFKPLKVYCIGTVMSKQSEQDPIAHKQQNKPTTLDRSYDLDFGNILEEKQNKKLQQNYSRQLVSF